MQKRQLLKESEDARKAAEEAEVERQRLEAEVAPPGPLPPDCPDVFPPGMRGDKMHLYKTMFCKRWEQGTCQFGAACHFAHGERELRGRPPKGSPPGTMSVPLPPELSKPVLGQLRVGDGRTLLQAASTVPPPPPPPPPLPQQLSMQVAGPPHIQGATVTLPVAPTAIASSPTGAPTGPVGMPLPPASLPGAPTNIPGVTAGQVPTMVTPHSAAGVLNLLNTLMVANAGCGASSLGQ